MNYKKNSRRTRTFWKQLACYKEGFRLNSSDIDMMIWNFNFKVIADISLCSVYDLSRHTIILMEDSVRLRLLSSPPDKNLEPALLLFNDDPEKYNEYVSGWSLFRRMKKAWANSIDMLGVLCNYRLGNRSQCLQSLTDLQTLLLSDDGRYVPLPDRDLSWQILGICQHVVGDLHGALQSYQQSLRQEPFHKIQIATQYRIALVLNKFARSETERNKIFHNIR